MRLTKSDIEQVAWLARMELVEGEKDQLTSRLNQILVHFETLQQLDTEGVEPTSHSIPVFNVFREDAAGPSLSADEAISNAPESSDTYFLVPQVVDT